MTDKFKNALDAITMAMAKDTTTPKKIVRDVFTTHTLLKNIFVINEALTLATEAEQLRKERDELAADKKFGLIPTSYRLENSEVSIECRNQIKGNTKWVVAFRGEVLNKNREWEYEPLPSSRDDNFIERTRFDSPYKALDAYRETQRK